MAQVVGAKMDYEYMSLMAELGEGPPPPPDAGSRFIYKKNFPADSLVPTLLCSFFCGKYNILSKISLFVVVGNKMNEHQREGKKE